MTSPRKSLEGPSFLRAARILDFDLENRPLAYLGPDFTTAEITAIAWCWIGQPGRLESVVLGEHTYRELLQRFAAVYRVADIVTGHYVRGHDLPLLNGAMLEQGLAPLGAKLVSDTKYDLTRMRYLSASQENLAEALGISRRKATMSNAKWREANRLTIEGIALTRRRVIADVRQHMALRAELIRRGLLKEPRMWSP